MPSAFSLERGLGSLRRAFAGHGHVVTHQSWLLNDEQAQANEVRHEINEMMAQSGLNELQVVTEKLTDQSLVSEQREFTRIKRKLPTIFIYVTPAGRDLYISRATTVKPAISLIRTGILLLVLAIILCQLCNLATTIHAATTASSLGAYGSSGGSTDPFSSAIGAMLGGAAALACLDLPFFGLLLSALVRSLISWIFEKDPWVLLRPNSLNEFQRDDVALLEQVTDDIIRAAVKQLGLDASKIAAPTQGYQPPRKIRFI
jgi:hypothetical protein